MTREEVLNRLLHAFPKLFFFIQSHKPKKGLTSTKSLGRELTDKEGKKTGKLRLEPGDKVPLDILHFQVLWLIKEHSGKSDKCLRKEIEKLFLKKHPKKRSTFLTNIEDLDATELIEQPRSGNRKYIDLKITAKGIGVLKEKEDERLENLNAIFNLLTTIIPPETEPLLSETDYESFVTKFETLADRAWQTIQENWLKDTPKTKSSQPTVEKERRGPSHIADCSV